MRLIYPFLSWWLVYIWQCEELNSFQHLHQNRWRRRRSINNNVEEEATAIHQLRRRRHCVVGNRELYQFKWLVGSTYCTCVLWAVRKANWIWAGTRSHKSAAGAKFCDNLHDMYAILAGTAGTQPALCAGTSKRQFGVFPRSELFCVVFWV